MRRWKRDIGLAIALCLSSGALASAAEPSRSMADDPGYFFTTPGVGDVLQLARIWGDEQGETHFEFINLLEGEKPKVRGGVFDSFPPPAGAPGPTASMKDVGLPLTGDLRIRLIAGDAVVRALHPTPHAYLVMLSGPGFEWKATDGTSFQARPGGPVLLADELASKGHITRGLGLDSVFLLIPIAGGSPKRPCAKAPNVLDCLLGK